MKVRPTYGLFTRKIAKVDGIRKCSTQFKINCKFLKALTPEIVSHADIYPWYHDIQNTHSATRARSMPEIMTPFAKLTQIAYVRRNTLFNNPPPRPLRRGSSLGLALSAEARDPDLMAPVESPSLPTST